MTILTRRNILSGAASAALFMPAIARGQGKLIIRFGDVLPAAHPSVAMVAKAAKAIAEKSGGRIDIQMFPNSQLGGPRELVESMSAGALQMGGEGAAFYGAWVPAMPVLEAPYIWKDAAHLARGAATPDAKRLVDELVKTRNIRILAITYYGTRQLTTATKPVKDLKDMAGFKLRVPPSDVFNAMAEAWGARPTPIAFGELYLALKQGIVDGQENPLPTIQAGKMFEVQKFLVTTAHIITPRSISVNEPFWRGLSEADRTLIGEGVAQAAKDIDAEILKQESALTASFQAAGMTVIAPDVAAFRDAVMKAVPPKFEAKWGKGVFERLQAA
jgi:tripartite ATP-independent transporter DctP family solute receptor